MFVGVAEPLRSHDDAAVVLVVRVEKMHIAGGGTGLAQPLCQFYDGAVEDAQAFFIFHTAFARQKGVVANGLHLEVIVKAGDLFQPLLGQTVEHGAEQFARLAGAADDEPFAVHHQKAAGNAGPSRARSKWLRWE